MAIGREPATDRPIKASSVLGAVAALVVLAAVRGSALALAGAGVGCLALGAGAYWRSRSTVVSAGATLFVAALVAAAGSAGAATALVGGFGAVLAADLTEFGIGIDRDADESVATMRVELLHAVASTLVAVVTAGFGYVLYRSVPAGGSAGVVALLFGGVVLVVLLR